MSIKFLLKKDGQVKNGFVGFSYTTFFFKAFLPLVREDKNNKRFFKFLGIYLVTSGILLFINHFPVERYIYGDENGNIFSEAISFLLTYHLKYTIVALDLLILTIYTITIVVWLKVGSTYNKVYTRELLVQGFVPEENDDFALALLKHYEILDYTEEEKKNTKKLQLYNNIVLTAKSEEKRKKYIFIIVVGYNILQSIISIASDIYYVINSF